MEEYTGLVRRGSQTEKLYRLMGVGIPKVEQIYDALTSAQNFFSFNSCSVEGFRQQGFDVPQGFREEPMEQRQINSDICERIRSVVGYKDSLAPWGSYPHNAPEKPLAEHAETLVGFLETSEARLGQLIEFMQERNIAVRSESYRDQVEAITEAHHCLADPKVGLVGEFKHKLALLQRNQRPKPTTTKPTYAV